MILGLQTLLLLLLLDACCCLLSIFFTKVERVGRAMAVACEACGMAPGRGNVAAFLASLKLDPKFTAPSAQALVAKCVVAATKKSLYFFCTLDTLLTKA